MAASASAAAAGQQGFRIERNANGIPGLDIAYNVITAEVEQRIFSYLRAGCPDEKVLKAKTGRPGRVHSHRFRSPAEYPNDYWRLINAVRDCGLDPGLILPNRTHTCIYGPKVGFMHHWDSRYKWGESVMGVNLGAEGVMYFVRDGSHSNEGKDRSEVRVRMPPRSIYIFSGECRLHWKHGIKPLGPAESAAAKCAWNPNGVRRSITLRAAKPWSINELARQLREASAGGGSAYGSLSSGAGAAQKLAARLAQQRSLPAKKDGDLKKNGMLKVWEDAAVTLARQMPGLPHATRFPHSEVCFRATYVGGSVDAPGSGAGAEQAAIIEGYQPGPGQDAKSGPAGDVGNGDVGGYGGGGGGGGNVLGSGPSDDKRGGGPLQRAFAKSTAAAAAASPAKPGGPAPGGGGGSGGSGGGGNVLGSSGGASPFFNRYANKDKDKRKSAPASAAPSPKKARASEAKPPPRGRGMFALFKAHAAAAPAAAPAAAAPAAAPADDDADLRRALALSAAEPSPAASQADDDDADLRRALALSAAEPCPAGSQAADDDDDLRRALALSAAASPAASQASQASSQASRQGVAEVVDLVDSD